MAAINCIVKGPLVLPGYTIHMIVLSVVFNFIISLFIEKIVSKKTSAKKRPQNFTGFRPLPLSAYYGSLPAKTNSCVRIGKTPPPLSRADFLLG